MHPLVGDLSEITDEELEHKRSQLLRRLQVNTNPMVTQQLLSMLDNYTEENNLRQRKAYEAMIENKEEEFDKLINIS